ncbi:general substrate transporter [Athelia psychrophila]|uniref:General substrate transporter n=1 Tax=Athelia psychrophila TaxID=1759441 RepID=A0A165WUA8_9AGAM|nr:general substrate transporter [Fibularhizoctonia sp. CBS 109695]
MAITITPRIRIWGYTVLVCLVGSLFGGDIGSIGSITQMPQFIEHFGVLSDFIRGFVVAVILIPSAVTGILAGSLSDRISRKYTISLGSLMYAVGFAISVGAPNLTILIVARCIAGLGEGFFLSAATVYLCEICPKHMRGRVICCFQLFTSGAIALGFFVCYGTIKIQSSMSWRLPFAISAFVGLGVALTVPFLPFSPRWLVTHGRSDEAQRVLNLITGPEDDDERRELLAVSPSGDSAGWLDIFDEGVRGRTILGAFLNVLQQLSGIDFVLYYAPLLFAQAGLDANTSSLIASGVTGCLLFAAVGLGTFYVDHVGRRTMIIGGGIWVATTQITIGALYASGAAYTPVGKWAVIVLIELFTVSFACSWAASIRLYCAEIQPSRTRAAASSFGQGANQLVNAVLALTSPAFLAKSPYGPYFMYGSLVAAGTLVAFVYMPETQGRSLETIDSNFQGSVYAVQWSDILRPVPGIENLRNRRFGRSTRRRMSALSNENGRPVFPERFPMERLESAME